MQQITERLSIVGILFLVLILFNGHARADGCRVVVGIGAHTKSADAPEIQRLDNPLGDIEIDCDISNKLSISIQHVSSISYYEKGHGLNVIWVKYSFDIGGK